DVASTRSWRRRWRRQASATTHDDRAHNLEKIFFVGLGTFLPHPTLVGITGSFCPLGPVPFRPFRGPFSFSRNLSIERAGSARAEPPTEYRESRLARRS